MLLEDATVIRFLAKHHTFDQRSTQFASETTLTQIGCQIIENSRYILQGKRI